MSVIQKQSVIGRINSLMQELSTPIEKSATELGLTGEGKKDPGGYQGPSTHPSARAASNVEKTPLGSRGKENEADAKKEWPTGVDSTAPVPRDEDKSYNIGAHQSATGEDPKVEDHYKGWKDDEREGERGGTSGPFDAERIGEKYSSMQFADLTKLAYAKMNNLFADIGAGVLSKEADTGLNTTQPTTANAPVASAATPTTSVATKIATDNKQDLDPKTAAAAGYELAASFDKKAAAQVIIEQTIKDACLNAKLTADFLQEYASQCDALTKKANPDPAAAMDGEAGGAGPMPPMPPPGGAGGAGPMMPPPGADAGAGGPPPGGAEGGAGGAPEEQVDEIINALLQMGATPEEIMQALQQDAGGAGGAGGPPPGGAEGGSPLAAAGGAGPEPKTAADKYTRQLLADKPVLLKLASAANDRFKAGEWKPKPVKAGTKEANERRALQEYIIEVCKAH